MESYVILDLETNGLDPFIHKIIGYGIYKSEEIFIEINENEKKLINEIWNKISGNIIIGFNIKKFDMFFLKIRSLKYGIKVEKNLQIIDLMEVLEINSKNKRKSLNFIAEFLGIKPKPFSGYKIPELWEDRKFDEIRNYIKEEIEILVKVVEYLKKCNLLTI